MMDWLEIIALTVVGVIVIWVARDYFRGRK
jgi:hypothetical protein